MPRGALRDENAEQALGDPRGGLFSQETDM